MPTCEYFPLEAVRTNVLGADALVRRDRQPRGARRDRRRHLDRQGVQADQRDGHDQGGDGADPGRGQPPAAGAPASSASAMATSSRRAGRSCPCSWSRSPTAGPVTITLKEMTRFLLTLDRAVDTVFAALGEAKPGEIYVPQVPAARMVDLAEVLIGGRDIPIVYTRHPARREDPRDHGVGGGVSPDHRAQRLLRRSARCCLSAAPESTDSRRLASEYSSADITLDRDGTARAAAAVSRRGAASGTQRVSVAR